jgi:hypothetical protein
MFLEGSLSTSVRFMAIVKRNVYGTWDRISLESIFIVTIYLGDITTII